MGNPYADMVRHAGLCASITCPVDYEGTSDAIPCGFAAWPPGQNVRVVIVEPGEAANQFPDGIGGWVVLAEHYDNNMNVIGSSRLFGLDEQYAKHYFFDAAHTTTWEQVVAVFMKRFL